MTVPVVEEACRVAFVRLVSEALATESSVGAEGCLRALFCSPRAAPVSVTAVINATDTAATAARLLAADDPLPCRLAAGPLFDA
jgi:hypothetical protein